MNLKLCAMPAAVLCLVLFAGLARSAGAPAVEKVTLEVAQVDSEETAGEDGKGANAIDGHPDTFWHTQWQDNSPAHPHAITLQISAPVRLKGITYLPRQGESDNGAIKDYEIYVSEDGKEFGKPVKKGTFAAGKEKKTVVFAPVQAAYVKLVALSEQGDQPWTSVAELGIVQEGEKVAVAPGLSVVKADSEETEGEDGKAANAVDGNPGTHWHTKWQDYAPPHPHELILKLEPALQIKGFTYLPRQDETENGTIKDYEFYVSADGKEFGQPVAKGTFENNKEKKTVSFKAAQAGFVKLKAVAEVGGNDWTSAAEITVIAEEQ